MDHGLHGTEAPQAKHPLGLVRWVLFSSPFNGPPAAVVSRTNKSEVFFWQDASDAAAAAVAAAVPPHRPCSAPLSPNDGDRAMTSAHVATTALKGRRRQLGSRSSSSAAELRRLEARVCVWVVRLDDACAGGTFGFSGSFLMGGEAKLIDVQCIARTALLNHWQPPTNGDGG